MKFIIHLSGHLSGHLPRYLPRYFPRRTLLYRVTSAAVILALFSNASWAQSNPQINTQSNIQSAPEKSEKTKNKPSPVKIILLGVPENMKPQILKELSLNNIDANINNTELSQKDAHQRLQLIYQQSLSEIHEALKPIGYYNAEVSGNLSKDNIATYKINLGNPMIIAKVDIQIMGEGKDDKALDNLITKSGLTTGAILIHEQYQTLKEKLLNIATQKGYFDAKFTENQIQLKLFDNQANVILHFDTGSRYHFGNVSFDQRSFNPKSFVFKNTFLQGYVPFDRGEYYHADQYNLLQTQLNNSGYFKNVYLETQQDNKTHLLNINAKTEAMPDYEYIIGPGYGTDTGPRVLTGFKARHLTEGGQKFSAEAQLSSVYKNFTADYSIPGFHPVTDHFDLLMGQNYTDISAYYARDTFFGVDWTITHGHMSRDISLKRHFIVFTPENQTSNHGSYLVPSVNYSYINQIPAGYFKKGFLFSATTQGSSDYLFSDTSFLQGIANGKISIPLSRENRILLSGQVGATKASNFENLPTTFRFYAGGLDSVLGYSYYSLSPNNGQGLTGGRDILTSFVSLEQHLFSQLSGMVFFNMGNAFDQFTAMDLQKAVGIGFSYRAVIGPINLYLAKPIQSTTQSGLSFNFSMGWYL